MAEGRVRERVTESRGSDDPWLADSADTVPVNAASECDPLEGRDLGPAKTRDGTMVFRRGNEPSMLTRWSAPTGGCVISLPT